MTVKKTMRILLAGVLLCTLLSGCEKRSETPKETFSFDNLELTEYVPDAAIQDARLRLQNDTGKCTVLTGVEAQQRKVSLVFLGMADPAQVEQICDTLEEYNAEAVFVIDGLSAAEDVDSVRLISRKGYPVGNYTLDARAHMEQLTEEEIAASYAHAQVILKTVLGSTPKYCAANATRLTDNVLHAAWCAGLKKAIQPTTYLASTSLPSFSAAMGYVEHLSPGAVIGVKLSGSLDEIEYEEFEQDDRQATDPQGTLERQEESQELNTDIVVTVQYLLEALNTTQTAVVSPERLSITVDKAVELLFRQREDAAEYELPEHDPVPADWFSNSLFVGDSLTLAMSMYPLDVPETAAFCAFKSMTPKQFVDNVTVETTEGEQKAVFDDICKHDPDNIFLLLGTNALASGSNSGLIASYTRLLQKLREQFPDAAIYVQGLPPVSDKVSSERVTLTNGRIRSVNVQLAQMAQENTCFYIDLNHALANEEGSLSTYIAQDDGIHLNQRGCQIWFDYLKSHVLVTDEMQPDTTLKEQEYENGETKEGSR